MKKYLWMSPALVVIGVLRVKSFYTKSLTPILQVYVALKRNAGRFLVKNVNRKCFELLEIFVPPIFFFLPKKKETFSWVPICLLDSISVSRVSAL